MAIICTNYLTGNDSTGTGATAAPYKTIMKALAGATSGDEIRAAGGQWVPVIGTLTFNAGSATVNTATNLTSVLAVKDVLTFEDSAFGFDKFHLIVNAITSTTITLRGVWPGSTITTSSVYKLDTYHYDFTTSNTGVESFNNALYLPNGRTGITVSGGWDATYTSNANGWTTYRSTSSGGLFTGATSPGIGDWRQDLVLDKFLIASPSSGAAQFIVSWAGITGPSGSSLAIGKLALTGNNSRFSSFAATASILGWWNPPGGSTDAYLTNNGLLNNNSVNSPEYTATYPDTSFIPQSVDVNVWVTSGGINNNNTIQTGIGFLPVAFTSKLGGANFKLKKVHFRSMPATSQPGNSAEFSSIAFVTSFIEDLILYTDVMPVAYRMSASNLQQKFGIQILNIGYTGPYAANSGISYGANNIQTLLEIPNYTVESTKPCFGSTNGATAATIEPLTGLEYLAQSYLSQTQVKDSEGLKTIDISNNVYFKDNTNNWLRISAAKMSGSTGATGGIKSWAMLGVLEKPTTAFTVSVTLKVDGGTWDQIGVLYGPLGTQLVTQSITPTSSFATYTISVDPANYPNWNTFIFPLYIGIRSTMPNITYAEPDIKCYVQSLSIV